MCIDLPAFLDFLPEFGSTGSASTGSIEWLATGTAGDTITIGTVTLTAVAGARVAGSLTWSVDGDATAEAASFRAALADSPAAAVVLASGAGVVVDLTTRTKGPVSLLDLAASDPDVYGLTPFAGGDSQIVMTLALTCPLVACHGANKGMAHAYLAAHFLAVGGGQESGVRTSRTVNKISEGTTAPSFAASDAAFATTRFGRLYLALRSSVLVLPMTTATPWGGGCGCG